MIIEQLYTNTGEIFNDSLGNEFLVSSIYIETAPAVIDAPLLQQTNKLSVVDVVTDIPEVFIPTFNEICIFQAQNVQISTPVVDIPTVVIFSVLISVDLAARAPTISRPILPGLGLYPATIDRTAMVFKEVRIAIL